MDYEQVSALQGLTAQLHAVVGREVWHYSRTVIGRLGLGEGTKKGGGVLRIAWGTLSTCTFSIPTWINWPEFPELMGDRCIVKANYKILVNSFWEQKKVDSGLLQILPWKRKLHAHGGSFFPPSLDSIITFISDHNSLKSGDKDITFTFSVCLMYFLASSKKVGICYPGVGVGWRNH